MSFRTRFGIQILNQVQDDDEKRGNVRPQEYLKKGKVHKTGLLYTEIVGSTLELYLPITEQEFRIIRDQRTLKGVTVNMFNEIVRTRLLPQLPAKVLIRIQSVDSTTDANIQVVDWICGALARHHERKAKGQEFFNALKRNIVQMKELFSEEWTKLWEKDKT